MNDDYDELSNREKLALHLRTTAARFGARSAPGAQRLLSRAAEELKEAESQVSALRAALSRERQHSDGRRALEELLGPVGETKE